MQKNEINEERAVQDERMHTLVIEGRNAVLEAFRSGKPIDKVFVLDGCQDGPVRTIVSFSSTVYQKQLIIIITRKFP